MAIGRVNTGGGTTGATLTVTGVSGDTVTITKDSKTYTRTFNGDGVAVFKGLATGIWTVTMTNGTQTTTRTVEVTTDYTAEIFYRKYLVQNGAPVADTADGFSNASWGRQDPDNCPIASTATALRLGSTSLTKTLYFAGASTNLAVDLSDAKTIHIDGIGNTYGKSYPSSGGAATCELVAGHVTNNNPDASMTISARAQDRVFSVDLDVQNLSGECFVGVKFSVYVALPGAAYIDVVNLYVE